MEHEVQFQRRVRGEVERISARVAAGTTLWDAAKAQGLPVATACRGAALCARCGFVILDRPGALSEEASAETVAKRRGGVAVEQRLSCQTRIEGDVVVTTTYW